MQEITGIEPELSEDVVQKGYATCIKEGRLADFKRLQEITGIKPNEDVVQKKYASYIEEERLDNFKILHKITGIETSKNVYKEFIEQLLKD